MVLGLMVACISWFDGLREVLVPVQDFCVVGVVLCCHADPSCVEARWDPCDLDGCHVVGQGPCLHMDSQVVMCQEVGTEQGYPDVSYGERPLEVAPEVDVQGEFLVPIGFYGGAVCRSKLEWGGFQGGSVGGWYYADGCASVNQEFEAIVTVPHVEETTV